MDYLWCRLKSQEGWFSITRFWSQNRQFFSIFFMVSFRSWRLFPFQICGYLVAAFACSFRDDSKPNYILLPGAPSKRENLWFCPLPHSKREGRWCKREDMASELNCKHTHAAGDLLKQHPEHARAKRCERVCVCIFESANSPRASHAEVLTLLLNCVLMTRPALAIGRKAAGISNLGGGAWNVLTANPFVYPQPLSGWFVMHALIFAKRIDWLARKCALKIAAKPDTFPVY